MDLDVTRVNSSLEIVVEFYFFPILFSFILKPHPHYASQKVGCSKSSL
jgi:hypothetical protein